jgi:hypothetical protein
MNTQVHKHSYTVTCPSAFRDLVEAMAARRGVNVGDLARSVMLVVPIGDIEACPDPGEPPPGDRETVILKSGPSEGRPWRRKPRLQVRMTPGYTVPFIRKSLALALAMERGELSIRVDDPKARAEAEAKAKAEAARQRAAAEAAAQNAAAQNADALKAKARPDPDFERHIEEVERLRAIINVLAFEPLTDGVRTREEALHILGFPPTARPDERTVRAKFRMLATIHHPDSNHGNHQRMSQLNAAVDILKRGAA